MTERHYANRIAAFGMLIFLTTSTPLIVLVFPEPATSGNSLMTIAASYAGNGNNPASARVFSLPVNLKTSKTTISCKPTSVEVGSSKTIRCTVVVAGYKPTGNVAWSYAGAGFIAFSFSSCALVKGRCFVSVTGGAAGIVTVRAIYSGDVHNVGSSGRAEITVRQAKTTLSVFCSSSSIIVGSAASCTATLKGQYGLVIGENITWSQTAGTGTVAFWPSVACTLSAKAACSIVLVGLSKGSVMIRVAYVGDKDNISSSKTCKMTMRAFAGVTFPSTGE